MINEKLTRGEYGYINYRKKNLLVKSLIMAAFIIAVIVVGLIIFRTIKNWLMLPSLLTVIPFANAFSTYLAIFKYKTADANDYSMVKNFEAAGMLMSDLIIVDADGKRFHSEFGVIYKGGVVLYSSSIDKEKYKPESHLNDLFKNRGISMRAVFFNDWDKFLDRINDLPECDNNDEKALRNIELAKETIINTCM